MSWCLLSRQINVSDQSRLYARSEGPYLDLGLGLITTNWYHLNIHLLNITEKNRMTGKLFQGTEYQVPALNFLVLSGAHGSMCGLSLPYAYRQIDSMIRDGRIIRYDNLTKVQEFALGSAVPVDAWIGLPLPFRRS